MAGQMALIGWRERVAAWGGSLHTGRGWEANGQRAPRVRRLALWRRGAGAGCRTPQFERVVSTGGGQDGI